MFGARKLQFGEFLDLNRGLRFRRGRSGLDEATFFWSCGAWLRRTGARRFRLPDFVGIDLCLAEAGKIVGDGLFVVETEMLGVGANESLVEDAAGQLVEVFLFDGLQHASADLGDVGNVIEREFFFLARLAEFISEFAHFVLPRITGTS